MEQCAAAWGSVGRAGGGAPAWNRPRSTVAGVSWTAWKHILKGDTDFCASCRSVHTSPAAPEHGLLGPSHGPPPAAQK